MPNLPQTLTNLKQGQPLIICDVDEVVLHFVAPFEHYLTRCNATLKKTSFRLSGNIIDNTTKQPYSMAEATEIVQAFHREEVDRQPVVSGAEASLHSLSKVFQIVFVTNVAADLILRREQHLKSLNLNFPIIQNDGSKAKIVQELTDHVAKTTIFIDDLPPHHFAVKATCPEVHCLHFMADNDFRSIVKFNEQIAEKAESWPDIENICRAKLN